MQDQNKITHLAAGEAVKQSVKLGAVSNTLLDLCIHSSHTFHSIMHMSASLAKLLADVKSINAGSAKTH